VKSVHTVGIGSLATLLRRTVPAGRIVGLDLARTVALVGMMATHLYPPLSGADSTTAHQLFAGRASGLFAVLAGLSLALVTGRTVPTRGKERVAKSVGIVVRSMLIFAIGTWLSKRGSNIAVILPVYAVLFVAMLPFLGWRPRNLAVLAAVWVVVGPILLTWLLPSWPDWQFTGWHTVTDVWIDGVYPGVVWLPYFWVGVAVGRIDLRPRVTAIGLALGGGALAVAATVLSDMLLLRPQILRELADDMATTNVGAVHQFLNHGMFGFVPGGTNWWLASVAPHSGTPFDLAQTIGSALAGIGVCLLLARVAPRIVAVLGGAGAMSLTMYTAHVLMKTPDIWPDDVPGSFPIHVAIVLGVGALFRLVGWRGPLEWAVSWTSDFATKFTRVLLAGRDGGAP
jgi:hypothetical protein